MYATFPGSTARINGVRKAGEKEGRKMVRKIEIGGKGEQVLLRGGDEGVWIMYMILR